MMISVISFPRPHPLQFHSLRVSLRAVHTMHLLSNGSWFCDSFTRREEKNRSKRTQVGRNDKRLKRLLHYYFECDEFFSCFNWCIGGHKYANESNNWMKRAPNEFRWMQIENVDWSVRRAWSKQQIVVADVRCWCWSEIITLFAVRFADDKTTIIVVIIVRHTLLFSEHIQVLGHLACSLCTRISGFSFRYPHAKPGIFQLIWGESGWRHKKQTRIVDIVEFIGLWYFRCHRRCRSQINTNAPKAIW